MATGSNEGERGCWFHAIQHEARQEWPFHVFQAIQEHAQASFLVCMSFIVPKHARLHRLLPRFLDSLQHNPTCNLRHGFRGNCYALWRVSEIIPWALTKHLSRSDREELRDSQDLPQWRLSSRLFSVRVASRVRTTGSWNDQRANDLNAILLRINGWTREE